MTTRRRKPTKPPKRQRGQYYITIQFWELECSAFRALSADATRVYLFMRKALDFDCQNNGHVRFSLREAQEALHSGWHRAANALAELVHFKFIVCRTPGERGTTIRAASEWQLSAFPCSGKEPTKAFMQSSGERFSRSTRPANRFPEKQHATVAATSNVVAAT
jgi:hypothetical protein